MYERNQSIRSIRTRISLPVFLFCVRLSLDRSANHVEPRHARPFPSVAQIVAPGLRPPCTLRTSSFTCFRIDWPQPRVYRRASGKAPREDRKIRSERSKRRALKCRAHRAEPEGGGPSPFDRRHRGRTLSTPGPEHGPPFATTGRLPLHAH